MSTIKHTKRTKLLKKFIGGDLPNDIMLLDRKYYALYLNPEYFGFLTDGSLDEEVDKYDGNIIVLVDDEQQIIPVKSKLNGAMGKAIRYLPKNDYFNANTLQFHVAPKKYFIAKEK